MCRALCRWGPRCAGCRPYPPGAMCAHLQPGYRRALPIPPLLLVDPQERQAALARALVDPAQDWLLQEFDGRVFRDHGRVRGPAARADYLRSADPHGEADPERESPAPGRGARATRPRRRTDGD